MRRVVHLLVFMTVFVAIRACGPEEVAGDVRRASNQTVLAQAYTRIASAIGTYSQRALTACDTATLATVRFVAESREQIGRRASASVATLKVRALRLLGGARPPTTQPRVAPDRRPPDPN